MSDPTQLLGRTRRLFDEAIQESFDALFAMPDAVAVVSAVADGKAAIVITGGALLVVPVAEPPATRDDETAADRPGMYL